MLHRTFSESSLQTITRHPRRSGNTRKSRTLPVGAPQTAELDHARAPRSRDGVARTGVAEVRLGLDIDDCGRAKFETAQPINVNALLLELAQAEINAAIGIDKPVGLAAEFIAQTFARNQLIAFDEFSRTELPPAATSSRGSASPRRAVNGSVAPTPGHSRIVEDGRNQRCRRRRRRHIRILAKDGPQAFLQLGDIEFPGLRLYTQRSSRNCATQRGSRPKRPSLLPLRIHDQLLPGRRKNFCSGRHALLAYCAE